MPRRTGARRLTLGGGFRPGLLAAALLALGGSPPASPRVAVDPPGAPEPARDEAALREAARLRSVALAEMEAGEWERAAAHLRELAAILPDNSLPPANLAICYLRLGERERALAEVSRARSLDPDNPRVLYTLARVLEEDAAAGAAWREVIDAFTASQPDDPRPWYLRARERERAGDAAAAAEAYRQALRRDPENLLLMAELLVAAADAGDLEGAGDALDAIEDRLDGFEEPLVGPAEDARRLIAEDRADGLRPATRVVRNLLRPTDLYQLGRIPLTGGREDTGPLFPQLDFEPPLPKSIQGGEDIEIAFTDATEDVGLREIGAARLAGVFAGAEGEELLVERRGTVTSLRLVAGRFAPRSSVPLSLPATLADLDGDALLDLVGIAPGGRLELRRGLEGGGYAPPEVLHGQAHAGAGVSRPAADSQLPTASSPARPASSSLAAGRSPLEAPTGAAAGAIRGLFAWDADHDGDLDLLVARRGAADLFLQTGGSVWSERGRSLALAGPAADTAGYAILDADQDGDLDLAVAHPGAPPRLLLNRLGPPFEDASAALGVAGFAAAGVDAADFDRDGRFDLLLWGEGGGRLLRNTGARFVPVQLPERAAAPWRAAAVADFDNDGDQDAVALVGDDVVLLRNRPDGFAAEPTGLAVESGAARAVTRLAVGDLDRDGDLDLVSEVAGGLRFWRNQGGERNQWLRLRLRGKPDNNSKNNTQGLGARIEVRAGDTFQAMLGNGGVNHLGLGARRQADALRVVWTNGLPQSWLQVAANQVLEEEQVLKGSCPFLYAWDGEDFRFVTDLMWGSPLGMVLPDGSPAPHQPARDWVLIPGEALAPADGRLWLQVTEELWEAAYVDRQMLLAVDHPAASELVVDERFTPPPQPADPPLHLVERTLAPSAARDHRGRDVREAIARRDGLHVDRLPLTRYQGVTAGHALELEFAAVPAGRRLRLLLWGWTFPTDSSINFALAQDPALDPFPPRLEMRQPDGSWRVAIPFLGFPAGKRKAVVAELPGLGSAGDLAVRVPTAMQVYWDAAALAVGEPEIAPRVTALTPQTAHLHYRGTSRLFRESASGPHLFDYAQVRIEPRFPPMAGAYTRYGSVVELLAAADDRYAVLGAGDELSVVFDARRLPPLPPGWRRDWVLHNEGWVKDGDLHTARSRTVEPLPYRAMRAYPEVPEHRYPRGAAHRDYLARYQTRWIEDAVREALR